MFCRVILASFAMLALMSGLKASRADTEIPVAGWESTGPLSITARAEYEPGKAAKWTWQCEAEPSTVTQRVANTNVVVGYAVRNARILVAVYIPNRDMTTTAPGAGDILERVVKSPNAKNHFAARVETRELLHSGPDSASPYSDELWRRVTEIAENEFKLSLVRDANAFTNASRWYKVLPLVGEDRTFVMDLTPPNVAGFLRGCIDAEQKLARARDTERVQGGQATLERGREAFAAGDHATARSAFNKALNDGVFDQESLLALGKMSREGLGGPQALDDAWWQYHEAAVRFDSRQGAAGICAMAQKNEAYVWGSTARADEAKWCPLADLGEFTLRPN